VLLTVPRRELGQTASGGCHALAAGDPLDGHPGPCRTLGAFLVVLLTVPRRELGQTASGGCHALTACDHPMDSEAYLSTAGALLPDASLQGPNCE